MFTKIYDLFSKPGKPGKPNMYDKNDMYSRDFFVDLYEENKDKSSKFFIKKQQTGQIQNKYIIVLSDDNIDIKFNHLRMGDVLEFVSGNRDALYLWDGDSSNPTYNFNYRLEEMITGSYPKITTGFECLYSEILINIIPIIIEELKKEEIKLKSNIVQYNEKRNSLISEFTEVMKKIELYDNN